MASDVAASHEYGLGRTDRRDSWWAGPLATAIGLRAFVVYSTFRACYNGEYEFGQGAHVPGDPAHAKERVVDEFYDPVKKLFRVVFPKK